MIFFRFKKIYAPKRMNFVELQKYPVSRKIYYTIPHPPRHVKLSVPDYHPSGYSHIGTDKLPTENVSSQGIFTPPHPWQTRT